MKTVSLEEASWVGRLLFELVRFQRTQVVSANFII